MVDGNVLILLFLFATYGGLAVLSNLAVFRDHRARCRTVDPARHGVVGAVHRAGWTR